MSWSIITTNTRYSHIKFVEMTFPFKWVAVAAMWTLEVFGGSHQTFTRSVVEDEK